MELQGRLADFERAGVALFAISYDPVPVLADFAAKRGVAFPLLSDEGSHLIRALGLYNEHLAEQARFYGRDPRPDQYGVPYPGVFYLNVDGIITERVFEQSYRVRPAPALLLEELRTASTTLALEQRAEREGVALTVGLDSPTYRPYEKHQLHVALQMAPGVHIYGAPVPAGFTALEVRVEPFEGLDLGALVVPAPHPFAIAGIDDEFLVHEGSLHVVVPFTIVPYQEAVTLRVTVRFQACTDRVCYRPESVPFELTLRGIDLIRD